MADILFPPSATVLCSARRAIDRTVDTQDCAPAFTFSLAQHGSAAMLNANDRHPHTVVAMPSGGFARTT